SLVASGENNPMFSLFLFVLYLIFVSLLLTVNRKWWVKVSTQNPQYIYYFGPFDSREEADAEHEQYLQDLAAEGATGIDWAIEQGSPRQLTYGEEEHR
ncbi:MAG: DUF1816 domain-containing protein, partial [Microcystaceae cyanobacterium]